MKHLYLGFLFFSQKYFNSYFLKSLDDYPYRTIMEGKKRSYIIHICNLGDCI